MPTVPVYGAPKVQAQLPQNVGMNTTQAPTQQGQGMNQLADAGARLFQKAQADADQVAIMAADKQLTEIETALLYDPKTGAFNKKGKDAFGSVETVNQGYTDAYTAIEEGLTNDRQKQAFQKAYQDRQAQVNRQLNQHVAVEIQKYDAAETESYLTNQRNLAIANPYDTENIERSKQAQAAALYQHAERNGMPADWAKEKITSAVSATNLAVLNQRMAAGDDIAAEEFYHANKDTFFGNDQITATKIVEEGSALGKSMREGDRIFSQTGSLTQAMNMAKEIENPKVRQATESRLQHLFAQKKAAQNDFEEKVNINATNLIDSGGTWQDFAMKNPTQWAQLPSTNKNAIMSYRAGGADATDWKQYYTLRDLAANPDTRASFNSMDLTKYKGVLAASEFKELVNLQFESRKGNTKGLDGFQADTEIVNAALSTMGYSKAAITDKIDPSIKDFRRKVDHAIIAYEERSGKRPNNDELQKMVDSLSYQTVVGKKWFGLRDDRKPFYQLSDDEMKSIKVDDIPPEYKAQMTDTLKRNGRPVTDQSLTELWVKKLRKDAGRKISSAN